MQETTPTPEQLISNMANAELQELLCDLGMDCSASSATRLKQLVQTLGSVDAAMHAIRGPTSMRRAG